MTTSPVGYHLRLVMQQPTDTQPVDMGEELFTTQEIPLWEGQPMLPPAPGATSPRRFDRLRTFIDTSPAVDCAFYMTALASLLFLFAVLGAL